MEELNKKVVGNAMVAYAMVFVCIVFLWSKQKYLNHPFVKNHVKAAFSLHVLLLGMYFVMSYGFLENIKILEYSINTIITAILSLGIFGGILYGALQAHRGKTTSLWEIFHTAGLSREVVKNTKTEKMQEEETLLLILAHIPFIWYIIYPKHKDIAHIRDVSQLNILITLISTLLWVFWYISLASLIMLAYIIWSVFQSIGLVVNNTITTLDFSKTPTAEEKYIIHLALIRYLKNTFNSKKFTELKTLIQEKTETRRKSELADIENLKKLKASPLPTWLLYIPVINLIWIFFRHNRDTILFKNGLIITLIFIILVAWLGINNSLLTFILFPICYGIGYSDRKAYKMPYIYDIYHFFAVIFWGIWGIFHKTKELKNTKKEVSVKINDEKKES